MSRLCYTNVTSFRLPVTLVDSDNKTENRQTARIRAVSACAEPLVHFRFNVRSDYDGNAECMDKVKMIVVLTD